MHFLVVDLAQEEGVPLLVAGTEYPIWTPLGTFEAAETLLQKLEEHKAEARPRLFVFPNQAGT